jgi:N-methylhydantoinase A
VPTPVYDGSQFIQGMAVDGPAIIEFADTTIVLWDTDHATVDHAGSVAIDVRAKPGGRPA